VRRLALALLLAPLVVAAFVLVAAVGDDYMPISDSALMELKTRDVGRHPVLTGLYSRDGWSHPGPVQFYVLAVPYRLVGERAIGLPLGALIINGLAIAGMVVFARRRGGTPLMLLTAVGCALLLRSLGPDFLRDPWNPYLPVLPLGLLIFLTWEMTCGTAWALPAGVAVASFCAQAHIGYVAIALPLALFGAVWLAVLTLRAAPAEHSRCARRHLGYAAAVAATVLVVMWLPPLIEELQHSPGNLSKTIDWFRETSERTHSLGDGHRIVASQFELPPDWLTGRIHLRGLAGEPDALFSSPVPVLLVPFALAAVAFWRARNNEALRLVATVLLTLVLGVVSVNRTVGLVYEYRLRWTWLVAMLAAVVTAWAAWTWVTTRWSPVAPRSFGAASIATLLVLGVVSSVDAADSGTPRAGEVRLPLRGLVRHLLRDLPPGDGNVVFDRTTSPMSEYYAQGLILELERQGRRARVSEDVAARFGEHRVHGDADRVRALLTVADGSSLLDEL
jgi:hypothetical protein